MKGKSLAKKNGEPKWRREKKKKGTYQNQSDKKHRQGLPVRVMVLPVHIKKKAYRMYMKNLPVGRIICCCGVQKQIHDVDFDTATRARMKVG